MTPLAENVDTFVGAYTSGTLYVGNPANFDINFYLLAVMVAALGYITFRKLAAFV